MLGAGLFMTTPTAVVSEETAEVGDDVTIYHGVSPRGSARTPETPPHHRDR